MVSVSPRWDMPFQIVTTSMSSGSLFLSVLSPSGIVLKYGGLKLHRQARPFFLGLILGGYMVGGFWTIVGDIIHMRIFFGGSR